MGCLRRSLTDVVDLDRCSLLLGVWEWDGILSVSKMQPRRGSQATE